MPETNPTPAENPLLATTGLPPFDRIRPEHVVPAVRTLLEESEVRLSQVESEIGPSWAETIEPLEVLDRPWEYTWGPVGHLFSVKNTDELREAYETVQPEVVAFSLRAGQSEPIYQALKALREGEEWGRLDEAQQRIIANRLRSAELAGIGLSGEQRTRFNENARQLSKLSTEFSNHVLDATKAFSLEVTDPADVEGMPESFLQLAAHSFNVANPDQDPPALPQSGPWRVTLDIPSFIPFMQHCRNRELREQIYRAYISRASSGEHDNRGIIQEILKLRQQQAELLGFGNYAEMSLATKMAPDVEAVQEMFATLRNAAFDAARRDFEDVQQIAGESGQSEPVMHWDIAFWSERLREQRFDFTDEQLRPYFALERVLEGLFSLVQRLFGVRVAAADGEAPVWHPDVRFFKVFDESDGHIASFYLDPYSRPEDKQGGAWMNDCLSRRRIDGTLQVPVAHLVCNSTPPVGDRPSLMTFREVETLFHEFGHGLQHMLTRVDYPDAAGISGVEWDAVELPSQFMENWCYHRPTLMGMAVHYQSGETLPDDLFQKIVAARTFQSGSGTLRQLRFGMTDMALHSECDPTDASAIQETVQRIAEETTILAPLPEDHTLCGFKHIFAGGYAAGYYSYKWAEVLSADAFAAFEEAGLDDEQAVQETGRRFRETVLALGGGRHPLQVFEDFRGREPQPEALLRHAGLVSDETP